MIITASNITAFVMNGLGVVTSIIYRILMSESR